MAFLDELAGYGDRVQSCRRTSSACWTWPAFLGSRDRASRMYCCGPGPLLARWSGLRRWPAHALRTERFVAEEQGAPVRTAPFEVELARTGRPSP